jgi:hypothetical protein
MGDVVNGGYVVTLAPDGSLFYHTMVTEDTLRSIATILKVPKNVSDQIHKARSIYVFRGGDIHPPGGGTSKPE